MTLTTGWESQQIFSTSCNDEESQSKVLLKSTQWHTKSNVHESEVNCKQRSLLPMSMKVSVLAVFLKMEKVITVHTQRWSKGPETHLTALLQFRYKHRTMISDCRCACCCFSWNYLFELSAHVRQSNKRRRIWLWFYRCTFYDHVNPSNGFVGWVQQPSGVCDCLGRYFHLGKAGLKIPYWFYIKPCWSTLSPPY